MSIGCSSCSRTNLDAGGLDEGSEVDLWTGQLVPHLVVDRDAHGLAVYGGHQLLGLDATFKEHLAAMLCLVAELLFFDVLGFVVFGDPFDLEAYDGAVDGKNRVNVLFFGVVQVQGRTDSQHLDGREEHLLDCKQSPCDQSGFFVGRDGGEERSLFDGQPRNGNDLLGTLLTTTNNDLHSYTSRNSRTACSTE